MMVETAFFMKKSTEKVPFLVSSGRCPAFLEFGMLGPFWHAEIEVIGRYFAELFRSLQRKNTIYLHSGNFN